MSVPSVAGKAQSIVVLANQFNPSIFTDHWAIKNGLFQESELVGQRLCTPVLSQLQTANSRIFVTSDRLQFTADTVDEAVGREMAAKAATVVGLLHETPYLAVGHNFDFGLSDTVSSPEEFMMARFQPASPRLQRFLADSAGSPAFLATMPRLGGEAKLNVRVDLVEFQSDTGLATAKAHLNYHFPSPGDNRAAAVLRTLDRWADTYADARSIADTLAAKD